MKTIFENLLTGVVVRISWCSQQAQIQLKLKKNSVNNYVKLVSILTPLFQLSRNCKVKQKISIVTTIIKNANAFSLSGKGSSIKTFKSLFAAVTYKRSEFDRPTKAVRYFSCRISYLFGDPVQLTRCAWRFSHFVFVSFESIATNSFNTSHRIVVDRELLRRGSTHNLEKTRDGYRMD